MDVHSIMFDGVRPAPVLNGKLGDEVESLTRRISHTDLEEVDIGVILN